MPLPLPARGKTQLCGDNESLNMYPMPPANCKCDLYPFHTLQSFPYPGYEGYNKGASHSQSPSGNIPSQDVTTLQLPVDILTFHSSVLSVAVVLVTTVLGVLG